MEFLNTFYKRLLDGLHLAFHIDTRAVELMSGVLAILTGTFLTINPHINGTNSITWAWLYIVFGIFTSFFSIYGPFRPRQVMALFGVYMWSSLNLWFWNAETLAHTHDFLLAIIPYSFFVFSSFFTFLGLWRDKSKWVYYYEPSRSSE